MQGLKELILIVNKNKLRSLELMRSPFDYQSKTGQLYEAINKNDIASDDEASEKFYPDDQQGANYRKLKSTLKNRLINALFFIEVNQPSYNDYQKAYYECYKNWAAVKIMLGKNARIAAIELCHKVIKFAEKYEFIDLCLDIYKTLRLHYGARLGELKKYQEYNQLYNKYRAISEAENYAEELYLELIINYVNNKSTKDEIHRQARNSYEEIRPYLARWDAYRLHLIGYLIRLSIHSSINDYQKILEVCDEALDFYGTKPFQAHVPMHIFFYQELICHVQLKQYKRGKEAAEKCLELMEEGCFNWFKYLELYFLLSMHTGEYQQAYHVFNEAVYHKRFQFLPDNIFELWTVKEAYIHYLIDTGKIVPDKEDKRFTKFRLGRFLNNTPIFSKDKRGVNIAILIIQILFLIQQEKYNVAIDKIEAIEKYCFRYLQKDDTYRSNCFIKMLLQIPIASFHKAAVMRKSKNYLKKLKDVPLEIAGQSHEIELIPYEDLWRLALDSLQNKIYARAKRTGTKLIREKTD